MLAQVTYSTMVTGCGLTMFATVTLCVLVGLVLWPKVANSKLRELIPDGAETIIDGASDKVREGVNRVTLPDDDELRFVWHLQKARELAAGQESVLDGLETARVEYKTPEAK